MTELWSPEAKQEIHRMPLVEVSRKYETSGLRERFAHSLGHAGLSEGDIAFIQTADDLASTLHANDRRTYEPFINHPIRVATLVVGELKLYDPELIAAAFLHDTVEDHDKELAQMHSEAPPKDPRQRRALACYVLERIFTPRVANTVEWLSFPLIDVGGDSVTSYLGNLSHLFENGPAEARAVKNPDHKDNSTPGYGEDEGKRRKLDKKQIGAYPLHAKALERADSLIVGDAKQNAAMWLLEGYMNARRRIESTEVTSPDEISLRSA